MKQRFKATSTCTIKDNQYQYAELGTEGASKLLNDLYNENKQMKKIFYDIVAQTNVKISKEEIIWSIRVILDAEQYGIIQEAIR